MPMISEGFKVVGARLNPKLENEASIHIGIREDTGRGVVAAKRENSFCVEAENENGPGGRNLL